MPTSTLAPIEADISPVLFGVEHEYNMTNFPDATSDGPCDCGECYEEGDEEGEGEVDTSGFDLPSSWAQHGEHCGWEVKTGIEDNITEVMATFRELEAQTPNDGHIDCGLHVHLNANPTKGGAINPVRFFENYQAHKAEFIYPVTPAKARRGFAHTVGVKTGRNWANGITYQDFPSFLNAASYSEVRPGALSKYGSIEVRLAAGTSLMDEMETYLRHLLGLAEASMFTEDETPASVVGIYAGNYIISRYLHHVGHKDAEIRTIHSEAIARQRVA